MAVFNIYKLHFTGPVHLGDSRDDYSISLKTLQSDTIYAAVTACLAKLGIPIPDDGDLGFVTGSLFPFYQKNKEEEAVYFLPKPLKQPLPKLKDITQAKLVKKVNWLDVDFFNKVICGIPLFEGDANLDKVKREYLTGKIIDEGFIASQVVPRVTISRTGEEDARPFYMDKVMFKDYSGLYFIAMGDTNLLEKGLELLQHEGVGTDRNVGNGAFEYTKDTIELHFSKEANASMALSIFIPESKQQLETLLADTNVLAYDFTRRGGWITTVPYNTLRKSYIHAFLPASVFSGTSGEVEQKGMIVNLSPHAALGIDHPIWRTGKAIFIPIKI